MTKSAIPSKKLKVAAVQFQHSNADPSANLQTINDFIHLARQQDVELISFPECCISGYWGLRHYSKEQLTELAELYPSGPSIQTLIQWASEYLMTIGAGFIEVDENGNLYNSYMVALPNGKTHCHRKLHTFVNPHLSSGGDYTVFDLPHGWKVGVLTCYDNNIFENVRQTALLGADVLLSPHQTGGTQSRSKFGLKPIDVELWQNREQDPEAIEAEFRGPKGREWLMRWLPSRAHDNGLFLVFSNGVGQDDDEVRTGNAMIIDPYGRIITETWKAQNEMLIADLDPQLLDNCTGRRWMRARRPELYTLLTKPTGNETDIFTARFGE